MGEEAGRSGSPETLRDQSGVTVLGVFVADLAFHARRLPHPGETIIGERFRAGPGGKGSNQAIAAARLGARVRFVSRVGTDAFGQMAREVWREAGVEAQVGDTSDESTGAAFIHVDPASGQNAIIVYPGAASGLTCLDIDAVADTIRSSRIFVTQLEQPLEVALHGLGIARAAGVLTVFNPAPAAVLPGAVYALCDYIVPNETELEDLTGIAPDGLAAARKGADELLARGAKAALVTLGERGALLHTVDRSIHVPAFSAGPVLDTTGAGDAFIGAFVAALARESDPLEAVRYACAAAAIAVTRWGTADAMPRADEVDALLGRGSAPAAS